MAKNFLEKLLGFTDNRADTHYPEERTEAAGDSDGLTGVARYLQKQAAKEPALTGVEKYLARMAAKGETSTPAPRQAPQLTSVERYMARQAASPAKKAPPVPKTRVEKYLAKKSAEPAKTATENVSAASPVNKAAPVVEQTPESAKEPVTTTTRDTSPATEKEQPAAPKKTAKKVSVKIIDLFVNAGQCQASTGKGTRCKRSNNLQQHQYAVGSQQYIFAVCSQHNNEAFIPHPSVVEEQ